MNAADFIGIGQEKPDNVDVDDISFSNEILSEVEKNISIVDRFDDILDKCPRTRVVRKFIREWLEDIETEKMQGDYDNLF